MDSEESLSSYKKFVGCMSIMHFIHPSSTEDLKMNKEIIVALVSMFGTLIGSFGGIITSSRLTSFRLEKLEQKVDKHNSFAERIPVVEEKIRGLDHRVEEIERSCYFED